MNYEKQKAVGPSKVLWLGLGLIALIIGLVLCMVILIPMKIPIQYDYSILTIDVFGWQIQISQEQRLALLVVLSGALGSTVHAATSFSKYLGQHAFYSSWIWWYLLRPFVGGMLALIVYFSIRAGILVNSNGPENINLFGILTISALSGMFSRQAIDRLGAVFNRLFSNTTSDPATDGDRNGEPMG